ncbi:glycosyl hydrolase family 18 protein [Clostridium sp. Marseille-P299]|uniref:glycosyl hydrolase family 18 protein n=1 Tax=Clostridium sp. Marseille-P299 TaxID=1805477 RepID=UPI000830216B|nr:glycosyl hydrolase family 18 protein [Clostridium sp. Marseille-P299]
MDIHVVQPNETVATIAQQYGVGIERLIFDNQIVDITKLVVGQALLILYPEITHQVEAGDTLYTIANEYGVTTLDLIRNNPYLVGESTLLPGQNIIIRYEDEVIGTMETNGYVYPFVENYVLTETLPYLTSLSIFSYGFTMEGELIPIDDEALIAQTLEMRVNPILVLTPFSVYGSFNNELVHVVSTDPVVQENLINNLLVTVREKGYTGVDVDFEFIRAEDREPYAGFIRNLTTRMNAEGYTVSVALAPKVSADQPGLLYEGVDYALLGEIANSVLLMTYEWGYTYGPPMAVAPINKVREVLDYAVTAIPPEKIDMGIPNYGYDWPLPFEKGVTAARSIGNVEAIQIAAANNAVIQYDEVAQSPFFTYNREGVEHIVWFEDVRSILAKLKLIPEYGFRGVGYWQLMRFFRQNWLLVNALFNIV